MRVAFLEPCATPSRTKACKKAVSTSRGTPGTTARVPRIDSQSLCVGQPQIEQDNANGTRPRCFSAWPWSQPVAIQCGASFVRRTSRGANGDPRGDLRPGAVLWSISCSSACLCCCGRWTFVSQKSLVLFTRLSNTSDCPGLVW